MQVASVSSMLRPAIRQRIPIPGLRLRPHVQRPLPVRPQALKQRYPCGKLKDKRAVTIALGILARNGVVIAADTQVGMPEYLKMGRGKIAFGAQPSDQDDVRMLAVTGA